MELDPRSLIVASVMSAALLGVVSVAFARLRGEDRIIGAWGRAMLVLAAGLLGLALRGAIPPWISVALANAAVIAALVMAMRGLRRFLGQRPQDLIGWGLTAALFLFLLVYSEVRPYYLPRIIAVSVALCAIALRGCCVTLGQRVFLCRYCAIALRSCRVTLGQRVRLGGYRSIALGSRRARHPLAR